MIRFTILAVLFSGIVFYLAPHVHGGADTYYYIGGEVLALLLAGLFTWLTGNSTAHVTRK